MFHTTHKPLAECSRCYNVEPYVYLDLMGSVGEGLPSGLEQLVGETKGIGMFEHVTQCPECGAYYTNTNECGFMENDIEVKRVTPASLQIQLTAQEITELKKEVSHPDKKSRDYALQCLTEAGAI